ncbi:hypothetical protein [Streptomyces sp. NPDC047009]|uniref:hypothetical protein n=1 Tax=Streptomyces sp. NPDC047009 TaxID=3154496 RepID=UPI0033FFFBFC
MAAVQTAPPARVTARVAGAPPAIGRIGFPRLAVALRVAGSMVEVPGGGSSTPPWRASTRLPRSARPEEGMMAVEVVGWYPAAVTMTV